MSGTSVIWAVRIRTVTTLSLGIFKQDWQCHQSVPPTAPLLVHNCLLDRHESPRIPQQIYGGRPPIRHLGSQWMAVTTLHFTKQLSTTNGQDILNDCTIQHAPHNYGQLLFIMLQLDAQSLGCPVSCGQSAVSVTRQQSYRTEVTRQLTDLENVQQCCPKWQSRL